MRRMQMISAAVVLLVAAMEAAPGCRNTDPEAPGRNGVSAWERDPNAGGVTVERVRRDTEARVIDAAIHVGAAAHPPSELHILLMPPGDSPLPVGVTASLTDGAYRLLCRVTIAWDPESPGQIWVAEETTTDILTVSTSRSGNRVTERYDVNGHTFEVEYPDLRFEEKQRAAALEMRGALTERHRTPEIDEFLARLAEFRTFYTEHTTSSLHRNPDAELLMRLIVDPGFARRVVSDGGPSTALGRDADRVCAIATLCGVLKCFVGAWANFLCVSCTGTSVACAIAEIGCWITKCDG